MVARMPAPFTLETLWTEPRNATVPFMHRCDVRMQIRNACGRDIHISKVRLHFQCEQRVTKFRPSISLQESLHPRQLSSVITIPVVADLGFKSLTNSYVIEIEYDDKIKKSCRIDPHRYFVFCPSGDNRHQFFISHKDPQDTLRANALADYLFKAGLKGYVAADDLRLGVDVWETKIPNEIRASIGTIFLWTNHARADPASLYRELELTDKYRKRPILVLAEGLPRPRKFPRSAEYMAIAGTLTPNVLRELVSAVHTAYSRGDYAGLRIGHVATPRGGRVRAK